MNAIKVNFNNEQEEKVLLTILDSLNYDYESQYSQEDERAIDEALQRSMTDFDRGRVSAHIQVMQRVKDKYDIWYYLVEWSWT